jgi:hypothetical protein
MSKKRTLTAADLMAELQDDAQFQKRKAEKDRTREQCQKSFEQSFRPYMEQLHNLGLRGNSLQEIVKTHSPLPDDAVDVLLSALRSLSEPRLLESVVRALSAAAHAFDGRPLASCFDSTNDEALKWVIANTIALAHPHSIEQWLTELRARPYWDKTLQELGLEG